MKGTYTRHFSTEAAILYDVNIFW